MKDTNLRIDNMNVHYFRYPLDTFVHRQQELGETHLVFWAGVPHLWVDQYGAEPHQALFDQISAAGLVIDAMTARPYNYTLFMDQASLPGMHSMAYYREMIDLAAEQAIPLLGIELWGALRDGDRKRQYGNCCEALRGLCAYAEKKRLKLAIGNVSCSHSAMMNTLSEIKQMVESVGCDNLMVSLDYGTAWLYRESAAQWVAAFGERLRLIYLSDARNNGSGYPLSRGCCPIQRDLEQLREQAFTGVIALRMSQDFCQQEPSLIDLQNQQYLTGK